MTPPTFMSCIIKQAWKKFYDAHHIFCDHNDADGDGQYDNCLWSYMTATSTYEYRYDENWQLTKCTEKLQNGITTEYDYQYDKDGNRSKYVKIVNGEWTCSRKSAGHSAYGSSLRR